MSEAVIIAAFVIAAGAIGGLYKLWVDHMRDCRKYQAETTLAVARVVASLERIEKEVGSHETGMRGAIHKLANAVTALNGDVMEIRRGKEHER